MISPVPIRIIKYSNRRLNNATNSRHRPLGQLVKLINEGHDVEVIDSKNKEDLTQNLLMQILLKIRVRSFFLLFSRISQYEIWMEC
jgi:polyhydroxyalkanoate synthesis regulator protein